jgi:hypothetical protein
MRNPTWMVAQAREHPDLLRLVHEFNRLPQNWVHQEYLDGIPHVNIVRFLAGSPGGQVTASSWIDRHLGLSEVAAYWDFEEERKRLALLDFESLAKIASCLGSGLKSKEIAMLIGRVEIMHFIDAIGRDAHEFALRGGVQNRISPQVSEMVAKWETLAGEGSREGLGAGDSDLGGRVEKLGWGVLRSVLAEEPAPLWRRFNLKIPSKFHDPAFEASVGEELRIACWDLVKFVARKLLPPTQLRCFD